MADKSKIVEIDEQIAKLFVQRLELGLDAGKVGKEEYRKQLNAIADVSGNKYPYAKTFIDMADDLASYYAIEEKGVKSDLLKSIQFAIDFTPKAFPARAKVACQGVEGAYSQKACDKMFALADITYVNTFKNVFQAVTGGLCDYGIVPIENSTAGSVNSIYDLLGEFKTFIVRSVKVRADHVLLAKKGVKESDIKEIFSHEQAINQCSDYVRSLKGVKVTPCLNTALSAKMVAESDRTDVASISSIECADEYGLEVINDKILNTDSNFTRFICIAKRPEIYPGANKTSVMFSTENKPGALYRVLSRFATLGINVTKLESRPKGKDFDFNFYFDLDCSVYTPEFLTLITDLENSVKDFKYFGSYSEIN